MAQESDNSMTDGSRRQLRLPQVSRFGWPLSSIIVAALIATPIIVVGCSLFFDTKDDWEVLVSDLFWDYLKNTLILAAGVTTCTLVTGVTCAWTVSMCRFPGRSIFSWALLLPLAIPTYLVAYSYTDLLQFSGPIQTYLRDTFEWQRNDYWFPDVRTKWGAIVILSVVLYPYVYLAARTAFMEQSVCALEVSRTLGYGPWSSFFRVALPLARPSIVAGCSLVLMETAAEFGAVDYCAVDTLATGVYRTFKDEATVCAAKLATFLLGFVGLMFLMERVSRGRAQHYHLTYRYRALPGWQLGPFRSALAIVICTIPVLVGFIIPTLVFVWRSWNYGDKRGVELAWKLGKNTFLLAAVASLIAVTLAVVLGYGKRLMPNWISRIAVGIAGMGYAVPGGVIAIGILIPAVWLDHKLGDFFLSTLGSDTGLLLSGTVFAVIFGYQVRFMAVSLNVVEGGLTRIRRTLDDASRTLGKSGTGTLFRVHLPLLRISLLGAALLVFVDVTKELPATMILQPFDFDTLAVRVHTLASDERLDEASTSALMIVAVGLLPVILLSRAMGRSRPKVGDGQTI